MKIKATKNTWFIIENEKNHNGLLEKGKTLETLSEVKTFDTEEEWKAELKKRGIADELSGIIYNPIGFNK